ncbi:hypothetical protein HC928_25475 [bacterium]|nr:hypothetical protein [bacterium]
MPTQAERFADNWAYLKTELQWLDRVLMLAVARQRQERRKSIAFSVSRRPGDEPLVEGDHVFQGGHCLR